MITTLENNFTQSEICCKQSCSRKWYYTYVRLLKERGVANWNFLVGNEVHRYLEDFYRGEAADINFNPEIDPEVIRDQKFEDNFTFWQTVFPSMIGAYLAQNTNDFKRFEITEVEILIERTYRGINLSGKQDIGGKIRCNQNDFMMDHKSTSRIGILTPDILKQRFQFLFYSWLKGGGKMDFIVNSLKKPALRQTKTESKAGFAERCAADYFAKPEQYFERVQVSYSEEELSRFQDRVIDPIIDEYIAILNSGGSVEFETLWKKRNLDSCYNYNTPCSFLRLCNDETDDENENIISAYYDQKTSKHEELETAN